MAGGQIPPQELEVFQQCNPYLLFDLSHQSNNQSKKKAIHIQQPSVQCIGKSDSRKPSMLYWSKPDELCSFGYP